MITSQASSSARKQFNVEKQNNEDRFDGISQTTYMYLLNKDLTQAE